MQHAHRDAPPPTRPNRIPWPPILYAAVTLTCYGFERASLLPRLDGGAAVSVLGWIVALCGVVLATSGVLIFLRQGAVVDPAGPATMLVTSGIYSRTRNPMYLGALTTFAGLAFALHSIWLLILTPALWLALQKLAVVREEWYLSARFGQEWKDYAGRVPRWL